MTDYTPPTVADLATLRKGGPGRMKGTAPRVAPPPAVHERALLVVRCTHLDPAPNESPLLAQSNAVDTLGPGYLVRSTDVLVLWCDRCTAHREAPVRLWTRPEFAR